MNFVPNSVMTMALATPTSGRRGVRGCSPFWATPPEKQAAGIFLNSLKGVALTHIDEWPLREIQTWSFDHMAEALSARFELPIKQAAHRQAWYS